MHILFMHKGLWDYVICKSWSSLLDDKFILYVFRIFHLQEFISIFSCDLLYSFEYYNLQAKEKKQDTCQTSLPDSECSAQEHAVFIFLQQT